MIMRLANIKIVDSFQNKSGGSLNFGNSGDKKLESCSRLCIDSVQLGYWCFIGYCLLLFSLPLYDDYS